MMLKCILVI